ncbi:MAG: hypothetical protein LWW88_08485 [Acinetobacter sp.]|uniref:hypothetical protein n=1 Tax=Acinetobacter sp. TaxID=472 RepID=UPI00258ED93F|nr:hypothetical protein [Acinetobacter sp.]MCE1271586.1 hypothetical protein [Acinetobacter sp.]
MAQLINKGGFRERANRSRSYKQSENKITNLPPTHYQPQSKEQQTPDKTESKQEQSIKNET